MKEDHRGRQSGSIAGKKQKRTKETSSQSLELLLFFPTRNRIFSLPSIGVRSENGIFRGRGRCRNGFSVGCHVPVS